MIYKITIFDGFDGVLILEIDFKDFQKEIKEEIISSFFSQINVLIDNVKQLKDKENKVNATIKVFEVKQLTIILYFHRISRMIFCSISDSDDEVDRIKETLTRISNRFWKKHQSDLNIYRTTTEKARFQTFIADVENLTNGGKIAELFPKIIVIKNVLEKIYSMGMITEFDLKVALNCNGLNSPLKISQLYNKSRTEINEILKKLEQLNIIKI